MKRYLFLMAKCLLLFTVSYSFAQNKVEPPKTTQQLKDSTFTKYVNYINRDRQQDDTGTVFSGSMLDTFFEGEINAFFTNTKDLALENYFALADTDAKTLTIGVSKNLDDIFKNRKPEVKPLYKLKHVGTFYIKSGLSNNFSKLSNKNTETNKFELNSGIGVGLKYTRINKGTVNFLKGNAYKFNQIRELYIKDKINKAIVAYVDKEYPEEFNGEILDKKLEHLIGKRIDFSAHDFNINSVDFSSANINEKEIESDIIEKKYYEFLQDIIEEEVKLLKEDKLYNWFQTWWWDSEIFVPITNKNFNVSPDVSTAFSTKEFNNWRVSTGLNYLLGNATGFKANFSLLGSVFNNNNFISENVSAKSFQSITSTTSEFQVLGTNNSVFVGEYDEFTTTSLKAEAGFLINSTIGFSAAIERNFDKFDVTNWKLAIPFSLKDKDDKPTVNFELQWKETYGEHVVGIGLGYVFGRYVK